MPPTGILQGGGQEGGRAVRQRRKRWRGTGSADGRWSGDGEIQ